MSRISFLAAMASMLVIRPLPAQETWRVDAKPILDIPGNAPDGRINFEVATRAVRLDDGRIVVADGSSLTIRFFDAQGRPEHSMGGRGAGPGEFTFVYWMGRCSRDSLHVFDPAPRRMNVFSTTGRFARSFVFPDSGVRGEILNLSCAIDGTATYGVMSRERNPTPPPGSIVRTVIAVAPRFESPPTLLDTIAATEMVSLNLGGRMGGGPRPLGRTVVIAAGRGAVYFGDGGSALINVRELSGPRRAIPLAVAARKPTREQYEAAMDQIAAMWNPAFRVEARAAFLALPMPDVLPPFTAMVADPSGLGWLTLSVPGDNATRLRAVNARGAVVADVVIPRALSVHEVGADYILGTYDDSDDVQHVALYRLVRTK